MFDISWAMSEDAISVFKSANCLLNIIKLTDTEINKHFQINLLSKFLRTLRPQNNNHTTD